MKNVDVKLFGIWDEAIFSRICFIIAGLVKTNQEATIIERRKHRMKNISSIINAEKENIVRWSMNL